MRTADSTKQAGSCPQAATSASELFSISRTRKEKPMLLGTTSVNPSSIMEETLSFAQRTFSDVVVVVGGGWPFVEDCSGACRIQLLGVGGCNLVHQMGQADVVPMSGQKPAPKCKT